MRKKLLVATRGSPTKSMGKLDSKGQIVGSVQGVNFEAEVFPAHGESPCWYAIRTRSRHEKVVAKQLDGLQIENFLPLCNVIHRWSDRRKEVELPLFPGYAFVRMIYSPQERVRVLRVFGVASFVGTLGKGVPIPERQINDIKTLLNLNVPFENHPALHIGERVRIRGGMLDGVEGILQAQKNGRILVISIDPIQRAISIDLEGYDVEVV
jgi:transcription antitermination factor NusG